ncbi:MAG: CCA tRNA nucleotidyltransferase [Marvinbryantia sp.]|uniref:CCA tRNA nucleotidyltransferase n=1 Tax=Marvinbryantia sp. TaxID=2496532 RepID=UPI0025F15FB4|nr:HD domain-containing protein [uncultured Marvinbryantia sp.]
MNIILPEHVKQIIGKLEAAGFEAFAVGGCVRDSILGREPDDWDITTSARPQQVKELFRRTVDTGIAHGTVTVMLDKTGYEVTTYRIDGEYADNRHPKEVSFTDNLTEDLRRRDFTVNAMAYSETRGLIDAFGGVRDLQDGVIRCVGDAKERFGEDALRILRAVRFSAQLGFSIDEKTQAAARKMAANLRSISAERIQAELVKLLVSPHPEILGKAYELGITAVVLPEFDAMMETPQNHKHHIYNVGEHTLKALEYAENDRIIRLAVLCHDFGKPATRTTKDSVDHFYGHPAVSEELAGKMLRRLKFDNDTIRKVKVLVRLHDAKPPLNDETLTKLHSGERAVSEKSVRRLVYRCTRELFPSLMQVCGADVLAQSDYRKTEKLLLLEQMYDIYEEILQKEQCLSLKELAVSGRDLIGAGIAPGKEIGEILERMLEDVLEEPQHNTKEYLMHTYVK